MSTAPDSTPNSALKRSRLGRLFNDLDDIEITHPDIITIFKVIIRPLRLFAKERPGLILSSSFILLMAWGQHGKLEWLKFIFPAWTGPGTKRQGATIIPGVAWDQELISWLGGLVLLVGIPVIFIKLVFKQSLADYGLGLPPRGRRVLAVWSVLVLTLLGTAAFLMAAHNNEMRMTYPLYQGLRDSVKQNLQQFIVYEMAYLLFFIVIEFSFRGLLLFGLAGILDKELNGGGSGTPGVYYFGRYALLIQMLSYTAWHLGKPQLELWGTLIWGIAAGGIAYSIRSIWPIVVIHWLLNVLMDAAIIYRTQTGS